MTGFGHNIHGFGVISSVSEVGYNLMSWGKGDKGGTGLGNTTDFSTPQAVGKAYWDKLDMGWNFTSGATRKDGTLWTWGEAGGGGMLGHNNTTDLSVPTQVGALENWADLRWGVSHGSFLKTDGTLWGTGDTQGRGGGTGQPKASSPVQVGALTNWASIGAGYAHGGAVKTD